MCDAGGNGRREMKNKQERGVEQNRRRQKPKREGHEAGKLDKNTVA